MADCILVGCDLHDRSMVLRIAADLGKSIKRSWPNTSAGRQEMIRDLHRRAKAVGANRIVFAYEACGFGYVLWDELTAAGIECYVLAPTRMARSVKGRKNKTDDRDARAILKMVRAYVLASIELPWVWIPDHQTRDDREVVRRRLDVGERLAATKTQVYWLLKRHGVERPEDVGEAWSVAYWGWLEALVADVLPSGASTALGSLLRQMYWLDGEKAELTCAVERLSRTERYRLLVAAVGRFKGVGTITAMTFLTELGDLRRFSSRRAVGSYLGLTPSSRESGECADRKGHITHQGPSRVRKVLCQAVWSRLACVPEEYLAYQRLVKKNPKKKKIAVVARMRHLAVRMWHAGLEVMETDGSRSAVA